MRGINITNEKKRDAVVAFDSGVKKPKITMALASGGEKRNVKFLKSVTGFDDLLKKHGDPLAVGKAIIETDEDIDIETAGKLLNKTSRLYKTPKGEIAYSINM